MSKWKEYRLDEIAEIIMGQSPKGERCGTHVSGLPLLNGPTEFTRKFPIPLQYTDDPKKIAEPGDILFCVRGSTTGRMNFADQQYAIGRGLAAIRHKNGSKYQAFLKGLIDNYLAELLSITTGSVFPNITGEDIKSQKIWAPGLSEQHAISVFLDSIDNKIDLLTSQNKNLEQLAETYFRQWFVEEAEDSWEKATLDKIATFHNGKERPKGEGDIPIYGGNGILGYTNMSNYNGKCIIIGRVGAYCGSLYYENKEIWLSDNALLAQPKLKNLTHYLFYLLKSMNINSMAEGSSHPLITQTLLKSIEVILPPPEKIADFENQSEQLRKKTQANQLQIRTLTRLRDTLLPKLMSGEIEL